MSESVTVWLISLSAGLLVGVSIWAVYRLLNAIPIQDRAFLDKPPLGFRVVWPLIQMLVHYCGNWLPDNYIASTLLRLKRAGADYSITPAQFFCGKILCAVVFTGTCYMVLAMIEEGVGRGTTVLCLLAAMGGFLYPELWLRESTTRRMRAIFQSLPFYLDVITLAVEAGSNLTGGITQAVQKSSDGPLRSEFTRVLRDIRAGKTRADALRELSERSGSSAVNSVVGSMIQAERAGSSLGPVLRAQSEQLRSQRFQKAEKLAMEAPVKLLGPLVLCIFPTTFFVIGFVILVKALQANIITWAPLLWAYTWPA